MEITVLGFSEASLSMLLDILYSHDLKYKIKILNNLNLQPKFEYINDYFDLSFTSDFDVKSDNFILGITQSKNKKKILETFRIGNENFISLIHKNVSISNTSSLKSGCVINPNVSIAAHTQLGNHVSINRNCSIGHHTIIEDFVTINPGCNIAGHVIIGEQTTIGMGTNIINNIKIGKNSIIGAGSLVNKDIPDNVVAWGSPCKIIKSNV